MKSEYVTSTKDKIKVSYSLYAILFELGLNPASKGTIYIKELIEYIINNDLYDTNYNQILNQFIIDNNYQEKSIKTNIRNTLRNIDYNKIESNFVKVLGFNFDSYYLTPSKFVNIIALYLNH